MAKIAGGALRVMEGGLADLATAISAKFEIPQRDVLHLLRQEFRKVRGRAHKSLLADLDKADELVEDLSPYPSSTLPR